MKGYEHELAHSYEHKRALFEFRSGSLFQSLTTAMGVGVLVASVGVALFALSHYRQMPWYTAAAIDGVAQVLILTFLVTLVLEQYRKRSIRRTLELAFLNHHIRNAITQMTMASSIAEQEKQQRFMRDAAGRISEVLFRVANSKDLTGLSLEVDLNGSALTREGADREKGDSKKAS
jgi:uncharacterized membrane protein